MEVVKLSRIVARLTPELHEFLRPDELDTSILLRDGVECLEIDEALEIIETSICKHQKDALIH